jgi:hypothetical protein
MVPFLEGEYQVEQFKADLRAKEGWWQTAEVVDLAGLAVAAAPAGKLVVGLVGNGEW